MLDLPAARRNIERMGARMAQLPADIRPHVKVHKSPELARMQVEAGAIGLSVATVWEAIVFVRSGIDHVFVVNTVAGASKLRALAELARDADVMVAVDDAANAEALSAAAVEAGSVLGVLVEVDTGMDRCGVDTPDEASVLAHRVAELPGPPVPRAHRLRGPLLAHARARAPPRAPAGGDDAVHGHRGPPRVRGPAVPDPLRGWHGDLGVDGLVPRASPRSRRARTP